MVGVKRRVDTGDDRNGKRTKTKTAVSTKSKSLPVKTQKDSKTVKSGKKDKKVSKKKPVEEEDDDFSDEDDDFDVDNVSDSEICLLYTSDAADEEFAV